MGVLYLLVLGVLYGSLSVSGFYVTHVSRAARFDFTEAEAEINKKIEDDFSTSTKDVKPPPPEIKSLNIISNIENRYVHTLVSSRVVNPAQVSQEVAFDVIIPETAFITGFVMEIAGKSYKAYVKEKEEAKRVYDHAVSQGQGAAHVQQSARDSERFSVSVNLEPSAKITFNLTYEELLIRSLGMYRHVININPGQIVPEMKVDVHIKEGKNLTTIFAHEIQSANEIDSDSTVNPNAQVERINPNEAKIHFEANEEEQKRLQKRDKSNGVSGQFVIEYDVERDQSGNEIIVNDGYFVHFFAPKVDKPLPRHVLFVLDVSGSMQGRKIEQLQEAMKTILDELNEDDVFNIIEFSYSVTVRNLDADVNSAVYQPVPFYQWGHSEDETTPATPQNTRPFPANKHYIEKAKAIVERMSANGGTNINDALKTAIDIAKQVADNSEPTNKKQPPQPLIIFLTDGEPTVGESRLHKIQSTVQELNEPVQASIFSLAFGEGSDFKFLKGISLSNKGFARRIYEAADATIQLQRFYKSIASLALSNIHFKYAAKPENEGTVTKKNFKNYFAGTELVIAGKITDDFNSSQIEAITFDGPQVYTIMIPKNETKTTYGSLERLWAYLSIRHFLEQQDIMTASKPDYPGFPDPANTTLPKEKALKLALKYSFVCPLTSLVVVKPNETKEVDTESAAPTEAAGGATLFTAFSAPHSAMANRNPGIPISSPSFASGASFNVKSYLLGGPGSTPNFASASLRLPLKRVSGLAGMSKSGTQVPQHQGLVDMIKSASLPGFRPAFPIAPLSTTYPGPSDNADRVDAEDLSYDFIPFTQSSLDEDSTTTEPDTTSYPWVESLREGEYLEVNTSTGIRKLKLNVPQNFSSEIACTSGNKTGLCTPLLSCSMPGQSISIEEYVNEYRCELLDDYAAICCSVEGVQNKSITESSTASAITIPESSTTPSATPELSTEPLATPEIPTAPPVAPITESSTTPSATSISESSITSSTEEAIVLDPITDAPLVVDNSTRI